MRGYYEYNFPAFIEAAQRLRAAGWDVVCPVEHNIECGFDPNSEASPAQIQDFMKWDIPAVTQCDAIALLPGWEDSEMANVEKTVAEACGLEIYVYNPSGGRLVSMLISPEYYNTITESISLDTESLTDERGENYGHPLDHFNCTQEMSVVWTGRRHDAIVNKGNLCSMSLERSLKHIVYMICDKLARAAENPMHMDNFDDIQGYASLWRGCCERYAGYTDERNAD